jgi:hypothetical protein
MENTSRCAPFASACGRSAEFVERLMHCGLRTGIPPSIVEELHALQHIFLER